MRYLHKAQSRSSVNMPSVLATQAAMEDVDYARRYVAEALAAPDLLCPVFEKLGIGSLPSYANF